MPVAEECLNCRPEATFHNRVNLWQSLALKPWRDPSPVFFGLRQAPGNLRLTRVQALAFQSWRVAVVLSHLASAIGGRDRGKSSAATQGSRSGYRVGSLIAISTWSSSPRVL
jgi:hypothetical protein